jgi:hypothetical protein
MSHIKSILFQAADAVDLDPFDSRGKIPEAVLAEFHVICQDLGRGIHRAGCRCHKCAYACGVVMATQETE